MNGTGRQIIIYEVERIGRIERERLTLEDLAQHTRLHPTMIEQFIEYGLIEPAEKKGARMLFDIDCVVRIRKIERLRRDLGANLPSVAVILDLLDRLSGLEKKIEELQGLETIDV